jgi:hypothetical protein
MKNILFLLCLSAMLPATTWAEEAMRTWTSTSGKTIEARFQASKGKKVLLENADGWAMSVPIAGLSAEDQAYIKNILTPEPAVAEPTTEPMTDTKSEETESNEPDETENDEPDEEAATSGKTGQQKRSYKLGDTTVDGYLSYRFKNGTMAIVFPHHRHAVNIYHPKLKRTYRMTVGGYHHHHNYARQIIDDVVVRPPNVRVRYHEVSYPFRPEGYTLEERKEAEEIEVLQGELRLNFQPDGISYTSYAKALVENAPRHYVHFHIPEVTYNRTFRGGPEAFKEAFADSQLNLTLIASPKKSLNINVGERLTTAVRDFRTKYKIATEPTGYLQIDYVNRAGNDLFSARTTGEDQHLTVSTYGNEPMERRSWIGHHGTYDKRRYNYIPHPTERYEHIRMKEGTIVSVAGEVRFQ